MLIFNILDLFHNFEVQKYELFSFLNYIDFITRATAPKFLLKYVLWHKSLKYFKKSCVIGE